ncbi:serine/threonine-protein kinase [Novosphingobium sp. AAP83]|uniref:serine/threonine-protein kinase n=1 Tax=Novosphingobium sp. AAP83 TaxID=1523425 RepID=UPI0006B8AF19|nr:serine/threonine-protein kinase [Novosphingobium sp. AAP83]
MSNNNGSNGDDEPRTIFNPVPLPGQAPSFSAVENSGDGPPTAMPTSPAPFAAPPAFADTAFPNTTSFSAIAGEPREVREGDVLNHLYEVRRFIARGGMGQVFEGVNINNDEERVAIKVILPHLARDPNVLAMFRKEARTLTRLSHAALVQYRTLAMEPQLGVFYIVTEYIDGQNLSDVLSTIEATPAQLLQLIRTLAEGLAVAHALGAIHRDISPDNIMLEGGRLDRAKVIDFGIAKDLDPGSQTIVGDGFAGKLNYVAPEQLGDFGREVGPWSDVYSLGLTILAIISKRDVNMGGSPVDAVDKRRAGPDLSQVPHELRPVMEGMLRANPADRLRTMEDVLAALGDRVGSATAFLTPQPQPVVPPPPVATAKPVLKTKPVKAAGEGGDNQRKMLIGAGIAAAVLLVGGIGVMMSSQDDPAPEASVAAVAAPAGNPLKVAQAALDGGLANVGCSWLDVSDLQVQGNDVALSVKGVAGQPVEAQNEISKLLSAKGLRAASIDFSDVAQVNANVCGPVAAFRQVRSKGRAHLATPQAKWELAKYPDGDENAGKVGAPVIIEFDFNGVDGDIAVVGVDENGKLTFEPLFDRSYLAENAVPAAPGQYRYQIDTWHAGWSGIFLLWGKGPFDQQLLNGTAASRGSDWPARFMAEARAKGWQADMVSYKTVNEQPD